MWINLYIFRSDSFLDPSLVIVWLCQIFDEGCRRFLHRSNCGSISASTRCPLAAVSTTSNRQEIKRYIIDFLSDFFYYYLIFVITITSTHNFLINCFTDKGIREIISTSLNWIYACIQEYC